MSETPDCPNCGGQTKYGKRDAFSLGMGETPIDCIGKCGEKNVGYRDHDFGDFIMGLPAPNTTSPTNIRNG